MTARMISSINIFALVFFTFASQAQYLNTESKPVGAGRNMKMKTSQVPTFDLSQVKRTNLKNVSIIPRLQVGTEAVMKAMDFTPPALKTLESPKRNPPLVVDRGLVLRPDLTAFKKSEPVNSKLLKTPEIEALKNFTNFYDPSVNEPQLAQKEVVDYKENDFKMLQALIYAEIKHNDPIAMGLLIDLLEDKKYKWLATFHYGLVALRLQLQSEFRAQLLKVLKESSDKNLRIRAATALVNNAKGLEVDDVKEIEKYAQELEVDTSTSPGYNLMRAKYFASKADLSMVEDSLLYIKETDPEFAESQVIKGLLLYRKGQVTEAITQMELFLANPNVDSRDEKKSLAAITLGRMYFQKGQYKEAWNAFLKVDKSHPLWLEAMIEQALAQIMVKDYEGASGNMFSLHTDFFKNAFAPETYILRSVGYLNLCQYGDGLQVLNSFKHKYAPLKGQLEVAKKAKSQNLNLYETVKLWTKHPDLKLVEGIPRPFLIEIARHPSFLNVQRKINNLEDESTRFTKFTIDLIRLEKDTFKAAADLRIEIRKAEDKKNTKLVTDLKAQLNDAIIENYIIKKAKEQVKKVRAAAVERIDKEKEVMKKEAHTALSKRFDVLFEQLSYNLDQNDILMYEIYAGAGEHIRYQMAGGEVKEKNNPELKVEDEKALKWKFKGEIWEDEIGHYRSSLKNVCANEDGTK